MSHRHGTYLGAIRCVETLRQRCVIDGECWHLRSPRGKPMPLKTVHNVFVHGVGKMSAGRAAWVLSRGKPFPRGMRAARTCLSYDCVNPEHIKALTPKAMGALWSKTGVMKTPAKQIAGRLVAAKFNRNARGPASVFNLAA